MHRTSADRESTHHDELLALNGIQSGSLMERPGLGLGEAVPVDGADAELVAAGFQAASLTDQSAMLKRIGHSLGLPSRPKPQTWLGLTSVGQAATPVDRGRGDRAGLPLGGLPGGIVVVQCPWVPASGRSQYSTRSRPGQPTIAVPSNRTARRP